MEHRGLARGDLDRRLDGTVLMKALVVERRRHRADGHQRSVLDGRGLRKQSLHLRAQAPVSADVAVGVQQTEGTVSAAGRRGKPNPPCRHDAGDQRQPILGGGRREGIEERRRRRRDQETARTLNPDEEHPTRWRKEPLTRGMHDLRLEGVPRGDMGLEAGRICGFAVEIRGGTRPNADGRLAANQALSRVEAMSGWQGDLVGGLGGCQNPEEEAQRPDRAQGPTHTPAKPAHGDEPAQR